ncbi:MAG TPA: hypothetical protein PKZ27_03195 [Rhodocyclaceae bacterium]|nr:hypothetical protein [Rhodocyclaceae bacterium]
MINPWAIVAALLLLAGSNAASFLYGKGVGRDGLLAEQSEAAAAAAARDVERSQNVEAIATAAGAAVAVALNQNTGVSSGSAEKIRTVVVPAECRDVDPTSLQELRMGAATANATLRDGLRSLAAGSVAGTPGDPP